MTGFPATLAYVALGLFWLNTLLIAAAAWGESARLLRRWGGPARVGVVAFGAGPEGQLAIHQVRQVGRSKGDDAIWFHDRAYAAEVPGGVVVCGADRVAIAGGSVWVSRTRQAEAAACPDAQTFARVLPPATRAAGWERVVEVSIRTGDRVWLSQGTDGPVIADADPRGWRRRAQALTAGLVIGVVAAAGVCTGLCLWPPVFGLVSEVGALAALVAFNLFQVAGKVHHEAIQPPATRALRGMWRAHQGQ